MKKLFNIFIIVICLICFVGKSYGAKSFDEKKDYIKALYTSNNLEEAYNEISKITEDERDYELWYLLGNLAQDFNNNTNATFYLQKSILMNDEFDKAYYNLANIYLAEKKYNSAVKEYKKAIKIKKDFAFYHYNLGCAYIGLKEYKLAKKSFKNAIKLKSDVADFYYNLAFVYKTLKDEKNAKINLDKYNQLTKEIE